MADSYQPENFESHWQQYWEDRRLFAAEDDDPRPKYYLLVEFPYPSNKGLHVGHPRSFTALDVVARQKRMAGFNVLYPMGWDAFGLPAENYAIKVKTHPQKVVEKNIANFRRQLKSLGFSFDWSREVKTTDPGYYRWTQWIFLQLFKHGLAYKTEIPINFCTSCKVGLANEEVVGGCCERCGGQVVKKNKSQWMLRITRYADRLIDDLDQVDYLEKIKLQQKNWIGRTAGTEVDFPLAGRSEKITVYTTRPDTLFGATYLVLSPEHYLIKKTQKEIKNFSEVAEYLKVVEKKSARDETEEKEKTGIELKGLAAVNPVNGRRIPIWVSDYVLGGAGTGAIMAVPAHDQRDWEFAKEFSLEIIEVIAGGDISRQAYTEIESGRLINSDFLNGLSPAEAIKKMTAWLEENQLGRPAINYKLRDWVFSRQRYWGEPIPMVYCEKCAGQKPRALFIHGFEGSGRGNWFLWLKERLEARGWEVFNPTMTTSANPDLQSWLKELAPYFEKLGPDDVVVGHSLGSKAALHLIAESGRKIGWLFLVASAIGDYSQADWRRLKKIWPKADLDSLKKFQQAPVDYRRVDQLVKSVNLTLSDDDPYINPAGHQGFPPNWYYQPVKGKGHFQEPNQPELLEWILAADSGGWQPLAESELPLKLPKLEHYQAGSEGESPLARETDWLKVRCPRCGGSAVRESDTMPQWAGSSWYFIRYCDPENDRRLSGKNWKNGCRLIGITEEWSIPLFIFFTPGFGTNFCLIWE